MERERSVTSPPSQAADAEAAAAAQTSKGAGAEAGASQGGASSDPTVASVRAVAEAPAGDDDAAAGEEEAAPFVPLAFLPPRADVAWGSILASHHDTQISGPDEWEVRAPYHH